ncbi:hypothetical protein AB0E81_11300 [Streptomyces sp. NPDC033538]|uniref:hypothetical protein n=1 Tax=Streptomyces sp. NPDC033538 TaxID=3155367 RepID=UPI0033C915C3
MHVGRSWGGGGHIEAACPCPGVGRDVVVAIGKTEAARNAVIEAAAMGAPEGMVNFPLFGAIDDYRAAVEHEAAERVRAARVGFRIYDMKFGMSCAATLIDPEVQT